MITLDEFVSKWTGKGIDFDGSYGNQCQDLYRMYVKECLGFPQSPAVPGAKDNWDKYLPEYYERIANSPDGFPRKGDVMLWGSSYGPWGHVGVITEATVNTFKCFSQNDPTGSLPSIKWYKSYTGVIGWLRPIIKEMVDTPRLQADLAAEKITNANLQTQVSGLVEDSKKKDALIAEITAQLTEANANAKGFRTERDYLLAETAKRLGTRQESVEIITAIDTCIGFEDANTELQKRIELDNKEYQATIDSLSREIATLKATTEASNAKIIQLETTIKDLKYSPTIPMQNNSIWDMIKSIFGK